MKEKGYPRAKGFGHEEWNFQTQDAIEGRVYGYVYRTSVKMVRGKFRIVFFAVDPKTKERLVAGIYHAAEFVPAEDFARLRQEFERRQIFERRAHELVDATRFNPEATRFDEERALKEMRNSVEGLRVRCPVDKIEIPQAVYPLEAITGKQRVGLRFTSFTYLQGDTFFTHPKQPMQSLQQAKPKDELSEEVYYRETEARRREIIPKHRKLSNEFGHWLKAKYGTSVEQERLRVDIRFDLRQRQTVAELKICSGVSPKKAIRESLGQLLDYNHYPGRITAKDWLIVLDEQPNVTDREFITCLRKKLQLPVFVGWRTTNGFDFHPDWPVRTDRDPSYDASCR